MSGSPGWNPPTLQSGTSSQDTPFSGGIGRVSTDDQRLREKADLGLGGQTPPSCSAHHVGETAVGHQETRVGLAIRFDLALEPLELVFTHSAHSHALCVKQGETGQRNAFLGPESTAANRPQFIIPSTDRHCVARSPSNTPNKNIPNET